jgi:hypothetical protein
MRMIGRMMRGKKDLTEDERKLLQAIDEPTDNIDRQNILDIIEHIRKK